LNPISASEEKIINLLILKGCENFLNMMLTEDDLVWFMVFNATENTENKNAYDQRFFIVT
jgi:hypothetical protein